LARARLYTTQIAFETSEMAWKSLVTSYPPGAVEMREPETAWAASKRRAINSKRQWHACML
jgi:hypothetical protein